MSSPISRVTERIEEVESEALKGNAQSVGFDLVETRIVRSNHVNNGSGSEEVGRVMAWAVKGSDLVDFDQCGGLGVGNFCQEEV